MALLKRARAIRERFNLVLAHVDVVSIWSHDGTRRRVVLDSAVEMNDIAGAQVARVVARAKGLVIGTCLSERYLTNASTKRLPTISGSYAALPCRLLVAILAVIIAKHRSHRKHFSTRLSHTSLLTKIHLKQPIF